MPLIRASSFRKGHGRRARGFSMLEAMLALAVLSVGLLGAAAMLLDSLRTHAGALHRLGATHLARDMADRIRANPHAGVHYDTRSTAPSVVACDSGCDPAQIAAADRARFATAARALFAHHEFTARVEFAPAIGPAAPDRYVISLHWRDARDADHYDAVALQVLAQLPVAG
ncbi:MAG TPA: type IV pilus modification protein PilV [Burkholderiaceae bacterium]|nr:type IV pilus modification protein PilV [Burkholderiaceae bacterium]